jgi:hypothetical protein
MLYMSTQYDWMTRVRNADEVQGEKCNRNTSFERETASSAFFEVFDLGAR